MLQPVPHAHAVRHVLQRQAIHYSVDFACNGYNGASHGCVNAGQGAIARLFDLARVGGEGRSLQLTHAGGRAGSDRPPI
jgi:hypothetical protein